MHYHRLVVPIKVYPLCHSEFSYPSLHLPPFDWWTKSEKLLKRYWLIVTADNYCITQMFKCTCTYTYMIASCIEIISKQNIFIVWYHSDVMSYSFTILLLNFQCSLLFSWQLSVQVCRKAERREPLIELHNT